MSAATKTSGTATPSMLNAVCWSPLPVYAVGTVIWPGFLGVLFFFLLAGAMALGIFLYAMERHRVASNAPTLPCIVSVVCGILVFSGFFNRWPISLTLLLSGSSLDRLGNQVKRGQVVENPRILGLLPISRVETLNGKPVLFLRDGYTCLTRNGEVPGYLYESIPMPQGWTLWVED